MKERRRSKRIQVEKSFSFFSVIPSVSGMSRIYMKNVSKQGLCLIAEFPDSFHKGQQLHMRVYTGSLLYFPIPAKVVRVDGNDVGVEFSNPESEEARALAKFLEFLELAAKAGVPQK